MNESEIAEYLQQHPDFFTRHLDILEGIDVPHPVSGGAISLLERQVLLLRKTACEHQSQFQCLVDVARENESIMHKSRRLVIGGLGCKTLDEFAVLIDDMVRKEFEISFHSLILFADVPLETQVRVTSLSDAEPVLKEVLLQTGCYTGVLSVAESHYLFEKKSDAIMSAAVLPLISRFDGHLKYHGILALGSDTLERFSKEKEKLFLEYLSELLSAILLRLIDE